MDSTHARIFLQQSVRRFTVNRVHVNQTIGTVRQMLGVEGFEVSLQLIGPAKMRQLNKQFRGRDRSTDVLSFPQQSWKKPLRVVKTTKKNTKAKNPSDQSLGDIVISLADAQSNAKRIGQPLDREFAFLLIHGMLHLCGHDHHEPTEERLMREQQRQLLAGLNQTKFGKKPVWHGMVRQARIYS